jgi:hypothetical protein
VTPIIASEFPRHKAQTTTIMRISIANSRKLRLHFFDQKVEGCNACRSDAALQDIFVRQKVIGCRNSPDFVEEKARVVAQPNGISLLVDDFHVRVSRFLCDQGRDSGSNSSSLS